MYSAKIYVKSMATVLVFSWAAQFWAVSVH